MLRTTPRLLFALAVAGAGVATAVPSADAAYPGANGKIVYSQHVGEEVYRLHVANPDGSGRTPIGPASGRQLDPVWSPDGTKIAYAFQAHVESSFDLVVLDVATGLTTPVTSTDEVDEHHPTWSPDGAWLAFDRDGDIWKTRADGSGTAQQLTSTTWTEAQPAWSVDDEIAYTEHAIDGPHREIRVVGPSGGEPADATPGGGIQANADWSPDGERLVYETEDGIATRVAGAGADAERVVRGHGVGSASDPVFSPDGTRIAFGVSESLGGDGWATRPYTAAADGSGAAPLHTSLDEAYHPTWQPAAVEPPREDPAPQPQPQPEPQPQPAPQATPPAPAGTPAPAPVVVPRAQRAESAAVRRCVSRRRFRIRVRMPRKDAIRSASVRVNGKPAKVEVGARHTAEVDLRRLPRGRWTVKITTRTKAGKTLKETRYYTTCAPKKVKKRR